MKLTAIIALNAALIFLTIAAFPQIEQQKWIDQHQNQQMTEMMKDSSAVSMLMDSIAANRRMCMMMMQKMMHHAKADSSGMMQMSKMMTDDREMQAMLTKLMDEQKQNGLVSTAQEILIKFNPGVQAAQISAFESEVGLQHLKTIPELEVRVYRITSLKSVKEVIAISEKKSFVKYAEPNNQYTTLNN